MAYLWSAEQAKTFWQTRKTFLVFNYENLADRIANYTSNLQSRIETEECNKTRYIEKRTFLATVQDSFGVNQIEKISSDIQFWATYNSWTFCSSCNSLSSTKMLNNFSRRPKNKNVKKCPCLELRYVVPMYKDIPSALLSLTVDGINALRPFYLYFEEYQPEQHGYSVKCCPIKLRISEKSVQAKIDDFTDENQRSRCQDAYDYLMTSDDSKYSYFVNLRETLIAENDTLNLFNFKGIQGIECALWPNLYPFTAWCKSIISDSGSRLSRKVSFNAKLFSEILDYSMHYDLLQFQYDRWLYKTVSGAINTARFLRCSPARSLDTKTFSATFWQWEHRYVLDAVHQFGLPDIFLH